MSESRTPMEPIEALVERDLSGWAKFIWNCTEGDNYFRHSEYCDLIRTLDRYASDLAAARAEVERLRKDAERWQFVRSKVSRILNEETLMMDGLRVEAYYDEPRAFVILPTDNGALFEEAIDAALAAQEPT